MRYLLLAFGLLAAPLGVFALTWDFTEDTTWGWAAQESWAASKGGTLTATTVRSEVADGVWRIAPAPSSWLPSIQLLSPFIGEDSALFDHVTLRLRLIHHSPTEGGSGCGGSIASANAAMKWENAWEEFFTWILVPTSLRPTGKT